VASLIYSRLPIIQTFKGNRKKLELSRVKYIENVLKGNENCFELAGGSSYRGFELPGVDCMYFDCVPFICCSKHKLQNLQCCEPGLFCLINILIENII